MAWYKITFPYKDCGVGGKDQQLRDAFATLLIANGGLPRGAAMFSQEAEDFETIVYYFSPAAITIGRLLIESYGAMQCPAPLGALCVWPLAMLALLKFSGHEPVRVVKTIVCPVVLQGSLVVFWEKYRE